MIGGQAAASNSPEVAQLSSARATGRDSYGQILKSSALIGGSSAINIIVSIARAKAMALLLGPAGVGLNGLYGSILDLTQSVAGMGINSSGVRQIAEAAGSGQSERMARTATALRRTSAVLGLIGGSTLALLSRPVSVWTFGTADFALPVALLGIAVFFRAVSDGQTALIQGTRRIGDLARISVLSAALGTAVTLALVYFFRERGIVPSLIATMVIGFVLSWWYRRRIEIPDMPLSARQVKGESIALLKLGSAFMASAILTTGAAYAIRAIVGGRSGLEAAGLYQAAWSLGGLYVGFILQAMGSDFYPRLTALGADDRACNRLVNEQAQVSLLLAGPGILATLTFAPWVVRFFYASTFAGAVEPLRWICLGMALRVVAWPMGFVILARNAQAIFFWTEVAATLVHVGLAYLLVPFFGVAGATMAFFGLYVWHGLLIYGLVRRLTGFRWSVANRQTALLYLPLMGIVFGAFFVLPYWVATGVGVAAAAGTGIYSLRTICRLVPLDRMPRLLHSLLVRFGIAEPRLSPAS